MSDRRHNYSETVPKILLNPSPLLRTDQTGKQDKFAITSGSFVFFFFFKNDLRQHEMQIPSESFRLTYLTNFSDQSYAHSSTPQLVSLAASTHLAV